MRIGIDARMCGRGFGLARYVEQLILHLNKIDDTNRYVLFIKKQSEIPVLDPKKFEIVYADFHWYGWGEQIKFKKIIAKAQVDLMHFPHWNVPIRYSEPFVVTIHDLLLMHYPNQEASLLSPIAYRVKYTAYRMVLRHAVRAARHIIATSEYTKQDIAQRLGIRPNKITVVYQAPYEPQRPVQYNGFFEQRPQGHVGSAARTLIRFGIRYPYILYVGSAYPHKNLTRLLEAWKRVEAEYPDTYNLVLAGADDAFYRRLRNTPEARACSRVMYTGFVSDADLDMLYAQARGLVFPSLFEGFGLPPLEAMARGVPVASSTAACLPEVLGSGAYFFDPEQAGDIAGALRALLQDDDVRGELKRAGREELARYDAMRMARQTREVYEHAFDAHKKSDTR